MSEVILHVYDLSMGMAAGLSQSILGTKIDLIPHTGIVIRNKEYFYGGGLQCVPPHQVVEFYGFAPMEKLVLGRTNKTDDELRVFLRTLAPKYTFETYDLFTNNCNHFTSDVSQFLLGIPIPERISSIPRIVLATPMGAMIGNMMKGMQSNMAGNLGPSNDPFTAMAAARGTGSSSITAPGGEILSGGAKREEGRGNGLDVSIPAVSSSSWSSSYGGRSILASTNPLLSTDPSTASAFVKRLHTVNGSVLPSSSPHRLTETEVELLNELPTYLLSQVASPSTGKEGEEDTSGMVCTADGVCSYPSDSAKTSISFSSSSSSSFSKTSSKLTSSSVSASWQFAACTLLTRILRQWPHAVAAFPALALIRLLVLREDCIEYLIASNSSEDGGEGGGGVLWDILETASIPGMYFPSSSSSSSSSSSFSSSSFTTSKTSYSASSSSTTTAPPDETTLPITSTSARSGANIMALCCLINVFRTKQGVEFAISSSVRNKLVDIAVRELASVDDDATTKAAVAATPASTRMQAELRQIGAALALNLANTLPVGSDTQASVPISSTVGDASVQITDTSVQLLCGCLDGLLSEITKFMETYTKPSTITATTSTPTIVENNVVASIIEYILERRLVAAGRLLVREGDELGALAATLGYKDMMSDALKNKKLDRSLLGMLDAMVQRM